MEAPEKALEIKAAIAAVFAFGTALFGWIGWLILIWVNTMLIDYVTGSAAAIRNGVWSSTKARQGLWHKLGSIAAILVAALADIALKVIIGQLGIAFDYAGYITPVVCAWYIFTELGSILENAVKLGVKVPEFLLKIINRLEHEVEDRGKEMADENKKE